MAIAQAVKASFDEQSNLQTFQILETQGASAG